MKYVALLRGINVGGHSKVEMARLKVLFESLGFRDVYTYINSGNVIFSTTDSRPALIPKIEQAIEREFALTVRVILRSEGSIKKLCASIPEAWTNDKTQKTDVMFLWPDIDDPQILTQLPINPDIERVMYIEGAIVWNIDRDNASRSGAIKIIGTNLYKLMTVRNINTVRKLLLLVHR